MSSAMNSVRHSTEPTQRNIDPRDIARSIIRATTKTEPSELDMTFAPLDFFTKIPLPEKTPTYPEINPGYPGPFLRDPGELDPWEGRYRT